MPRRARPLIAWLCDTARSHRAAESGGANPPQKSAEGTRQTVKVECGTVPFFRHNDRLIYFSHVPKCGGTSIEDGLSNCGIALSFMDRDWWRLGADRWNNSSPQHILCKDVARLMDLRMFDFRFTCVRDPVARFLSAYHHNKEDGFIPRFVSLSRFISRLERREDFFSYRFDNHFVPAADIVPGDCKVFHLESGLDEIGHWLREVTADDGLHLTFAHHNRRDWNRPSVCANPLKKLVKDLLIPKTPQLSSLDPRLRARIERLYARDYERFFR